MKSMIWVCIRQAKLHSTTQCLGSNTKRETVRDHCTGLSFAFIAHAQLFSQLTHHLKQGS